MKYFAMETIKNCSSMFCIIGKPLVNILSKMYSTIRIVLGMDIFPHRSRAKTLQNINDRTIIHEQIICQGPPNIGIFVSLADFGAPQQRHVPNTLHLITCGRRNSRMKPKQMKHAVNKSISVNQSSNCMQN
jgi:hypothetical protein